MEGENNKVDGYEEEEEEEESEYVLIDLDAVSGQIDIPPYAPYILSGLDTANPILIIDKKVKLIGEYEESIGTCLVFSEEASPLVHEETGSSEANLFSGKCSVVDTNQVPRKRVKPVARIHKILKFKLLLDDVHDETDAPANSNL